ncbi:934_t:CDS:1, partial [Acaulospora colombiana]
VPKCQEIILKDLDLGFDQRDIKFRMGLPSAEEHGPSDKAPNPATSSSTPNNVSSRRGLNAKLQSLPFAKFLSSNMHWGTLSSVTMEKIPDMAARMCVDFVRGVSVIHYQHPVGRGLENLRLMDFSWSDWKWILDDGISGADDHSLEGTGISLPTLRHLSVAIEYRYESEATRSNSSKEMVNNSGVAREWTNERNQWMAGLTDFAKKRMSRVAVFRMLQQWNTEVPLWLVNDKGADVSWKQRSVDGQSNSGGPRWDSEPPNLSSGSTEATGAEYPNRTVLNISLDSGYIDSYAFVHAAWIAIQEEEVQSEIA